MRSMAPERAWQWILGAQQPGYKVFAPFASCRSAGHSLVAACFQMANSEGSQRDVYTSFFYHVPMARKH